MPSRAQGPPGVCGAAPRCGSRWAAGGALGLPNCCRVLLLEQLGNCTHHLALNPLVSPGPQLAGPWASSLEVGGVSSLFRG